MIRYIAKPPHIIREKFPGFIWESPEGIIFTIDDGPSVELTNMLLKKFSEHKIKAMFFLLGKRVRVNPSLVKEIYSEGHLVCNHTFNHLALPLLSVEEAEKEIRRTDNLIESIISVKPSFFRPPYGLFDIRTPKILKKCDLKNVMWSLLSLDYRGNLHQVKKVISSYLRSNSIIVFHDNAKSAKVLEEAIDFTFELILKSNFIIGDPVKCFLK